MIHQSFQETEFLSFYIQQRFNNKSSFGVPYVSFQVIFGFEYILFESEFGLDKIADDPRLFVQKIFLPLHCRIYSILLPSNFVVDQHFYILSLRSKSVSVISVVIVRRPIVFLIL